MIYSFIYLFNFFFKVEIDIMHVVKMLFSPSAYGCSKIKKNHYRDIIPDVSHSHLVARYSLSFVLRVRRPTKIKFIYQLSVWPLFLSFTNLYSFPDDGRQTFIVVLYVQTYNMCWSYVVAAKLMILFCAHFVMMQIISSDQASYVRPQ